MAKSPLLRDCCKIKFAIQLFHLPRGEIEYFHSGFWLWGRMFRSFICSSLILTPVSYQRLSNTAFTRSPRRVVVALIMFTTVSKLTRGSPFQFILINENIRCSILFHLLVPGG